MIGVDSSTQQQTILVSTGVLPITPSPAINGSALASTVSTTSLTSSAGDKEFDVSKSSKCELADCGDKQGSRDSQVSLAVEIKGRHAPDKD